jgi:hypothetical protein
MSQLGAGNHGVDVQVDLDLVKRFALVGEGNDLVAPHFE